MTTTTTTAVVTDTCRSLTRLIDRVATIGGRVTQARIDGHDIALHVAPQHGQRVAKDLHLTEDHVGGISRTWAGAWAGHRLRVTCLTGEGA